MAKHEGCPTNPILVGASASMREIIEMVDTVARSDCCVLIEGESGTGKELVARRLHAKSPRRGKLFIPVNCAGISETLFESQFFGHVRGAFTGAHADKPGRFASAEGGTLFFDEVGEIPLQNQVNLLRVLEEKSFTPLGSMVSVGSDVRYWE